MLFVLEFFERCFYWRYSNHCTGVMQKVCLSCLYKKGLAKVEYIKVLTVKKLKNIQINIDLNQ